MKSELVYSSPVRKEISKVLYQRDMTKNQKKKMVHEKNLAMGLLQCELATYPISHFKRQDHLQTKILLKHFLWDTRVVAGTLDTSPMVKSLSWTIFFHNFELNVFKRECFYKRVFFLSGLMCSIVH